MPNRFFTILVVPEKTQKVRRIILPSYVAKGAMVALIFIVLISVIMVLNYANVINQITENKKLRVENRQLRQSVQVFKDKIITMETTLDRVKTFSTKLRIITNIEDNSSSSSQPSFTPAPPSSSLSAPLPTDALPDSSSNQIPVKEEEKITSTGMEADTDEEYAPIDASKDPVAQRAQRKNLIAALMNDSAPALSLSDADTSIFVKTEFDKLDRAYEEVQRFAEEQEQSIQFILEKLGEKRALISGTPTRLPTLGYVTSDYGVRISPFDSRRKMHEGLDIANRFGADVIAPANGLVSFVGNKSGYGKVVILDHGNGIETYFAHLSRFNVKPGSRIKRGNIIAFVGNSGHSTGPHLHYEVRANGLPVDPCWYILDQPTVCRSR